MADEKDWVHVRVRKTLADQLRVIAEREHRYGIQTDTNLAIEMYIKQTRGMVVYGIFKNDRCVYVGATSGMSERARCHWKKFGSDCRIEIFGATTSFSLLKEIETKYIKKFKALGQADFNLNENGGTNQKFDRLRLKDSPLKKHYRRDDGR